MKPFQYTRSWRSPADFPTVETDETQVREDMQCLFDEAAEAINDLITAVNTGTGGGTGGTAPALDTTLTLPGAAAEAAAVGAALGDIAAALEAILGEERA